jgi:hypothetical protein
MSCPSPVERSVLYAALIQQTGRPAIDLLLDRSGPGRREWNSPAPLNDRESHPRHPLRPLEE